ncbi:hypoxanthine/guanine phosphoribosyltransferase [Salinilacihabitans rarus]|uniref:hypoxanthine/guanine phosphoribosyltransferase n=1 Tax=Salinilacihabitans rarus TaxID=2961596 RepID=UPI0020C8BB48|nr:hypoxanthine/guanine phosphoribosyltransferase [Salinilacihabitans rarus]
MDQLRRSLRDAPVVSRDGYDYFVHGVTDGVPPVEPAILREVVDAVRERIDFDGVDLLVAPEAMGVHHATALSLSTDVPFVVVRKRSYGFPDEVAVHQRTGYGESDFHLNGVEAGDRVVLVDDVLSSGSTIRAVSAALAEAGAEVADVVVVLERVDADPGELPHEVTSLLRVRVEDGAVEVVD